MTLPKAERNVSTKRCYAYSSNSSKRRDACMASAEINRLLNTWKRGHTNDRHARN